MEPEGSLLCSQEPATGLYPEHPGYLLDNYKYLHNASNVLSVCSFILFITFFILRARGCWILTAAT